MKTKYSLMTVAILASAFSGCAHLRRIPGAPIQPASAESATTALEMRQTRTIRGPQASPTVIQLSDENPLKSLEKEIESIRTERVIIPTRVLRTLIASRKAATSGGQCEDLSNQLEALKTIDLEETENGVEQ